MALAKVLGRSRILSLSRTLILAALAVGPAGCSWLPDYANPVEWYRDVTGASQNDNASAAQPNVKNLEAGGNEPYPNLATVPAVPENAMSTVDRNKLQKGLIADRAHAEYSNQALHEGQNVPPLPGTEPKVAMAAPITAQGAAAPGAAAGAGSAPTNTTPAPARPHPPKVARGSEPPPQESPLVSPSIPGLPQGEAPRGAPPKPNEQLAVVVPPPPIPPPAIVMPGAPATPAERVPAMRPASGRRASLEEAQITFAGAGGTLSAEDNQRLTEVAKRQKQAGGSLRVIGYGARGSGPDAAQQELKNFGAALDRANMVAQALAKLGVPASRMSVQEAPTLAESKRANGQVVVVLQE
jgi:outer membrane protein OmpA-like peptidoglycan-associated protein